MGDGSGTSNDFPPVGSPDRYDMIVQRGRALRRRRRYTLGAGAGGTVVALAVAVVLISSNGSSDVTSAEFADGSPATTGVTTTSSTLPPVPTVMGVRIETGTSPATITVEDPAQPVSDESRQCVLLTLSSADDDVVAEGWGCNDPLTPSGLVSVQLLATDGVAIGCARQESRLDPADYEDTPTEVVSTSFTYQTDSSLPKGDYELTASATSGIGDGCVGSVPGSTEIEASAEASAMVELP